MWKIAPVQLPTVHWRRTDFARSTTAIDRKIRQQYSQMFDDDRWDDGPAAIAVQYACWAGWEPAARLFCGEGSRRDLASSQARKIAS